MAPRGRGTSSGAALRGRGRGRGSGGGGGGGGGEQKVGPSTAATTTTTLLHDPGLSVNWLPHEQSTLQQLHTKYASEPSIIRYALIAKALEDKTIRDVALRCGWTTQMARRKNVNNRERVTDSNSSNGQPTISPDGISYRDIGGDAGQICQQTAEAFGLIAANLAKHEILDNIRYFSQARHNIVKIVNLSKNIPGEVKQMPPLPGLDEESVKFIFEIAEMMMQYDSLQLD